MAAPVGHERHAQLVAHAVRRVEVPVAGRPAGPAFRLQRQHPGRPPLGEHVGEREHVRPEQLELPEGGHRRRRQLAQHAARPQQRAGIDRHEQGRVERHQAIERAEHPAQERLRAVPGGAVRRAMLARTSRATLAVAIEWTGMAAAMLGPAGPLVPLIPTLIPPPTGRAARPSWG